MQELRKKSYRPLKKSTVQLTSLLDLLFVMIFVSLMQEKITPEMREKLKQKDIPKKGKITTLKTKTKTKTKTKAKTKVKKNPVVLRSYGVEAIFYFKPTSANPNIPSGTYKMFGSFDEKTRKLKLSGVEWVDRPGPEYGMVPLSGTIQSGDSLFTGRIDFQGCKTFNLKRIQKINNNPISGVWEGEYDCQQGSTGLTLTIK